MPSDVGWKLTGVLLLISSAAFLGSVSGWLLWKLVEWGIK